MGHKVEGLLNCNSYVTKTLNLPSVLLDRLVYSLNHPMDLMHRRHHAPILEVI